MEKIRLLLIFGLVLLASNAYAQCTEEEVYSSSECLNQQLDSNPGSVNFDKVSASQIKEVNDPNKIPDDVLDDRINDLDKSQVEKLDESTLKDIDPKAFNDNPEVLTKLTDDQLKKLPPETVQKLTPLALSQGTPSIANRLGIPIKGNVRDGCGAKESGGKYTLKCGDNNYDLTSEFSMGADGTITTGEGMNQKTFTGSGDLKEEDGEISGSGDWQVNYPRNINSITLSGSGEFTLGADGTSTGTGNWQMEERDADGNIVSSISGSGTFKTNSFGQIDVSGETPWKITMPDGMGNPVSFEGTGLLTPGGGGTIEGQGDWKMEDPSNPGQFVDMKDADFYYTDHGLAIKFATVDGEEVENSFKFTEDGRKVFTDIAGDSEVMTDGELDPEKILAKYGDVGFMFLAEEGSYMHCITQMALDTVIAGVYEEDDFAQEIANDPHILDTTGLNPDDSRTLMDDNPQLSELFRLMLNDPTLMDEDGKYDVDKVLAKALEEFDLMDETEIATLRATMNYLEDESSSDVPDDVPDIYHPNYNPDTEEIDPNWEAYDPGVDNETSALEDYHVGPNTETPGDLNYETYQNLIDQNYLEGMTFDAKDLDLIVKEPAPTSGFSYIGGTLYYNLGDSEKVVTTLKTGEVGTMGDKAEFVIPGQFEVHEARTYGSKMVGGEMTTNVEVASDPIMFTLKMLEKVFIDFDGNGIDDFAMKLLSIDSILVSTFEFSLISPRKLLDNEGLSTYGKISEYDDDYGNEIKDGENIFISKTVSGSHAEELNDMNGATFKDVDNFTVYADGSTVEQASEAIDAGGNSNEDVLDFEYIVNDDVTTVSFENASQLTVDGVVIENVANGEVEFNSTTGDLLSVSIESTVDDNSFMMETPKGMEMAISDLDEGEVIEWDSREVEFAIRVRGSVKAGFIPIAEFRSNDAFGELRFEEFSHHIFYRFRNGNLSIVDLEIGYDEYISTDNIEGFSTAEVYYDYGVRCQNLTKDTKYEYRHDIINRSFAINSKSQYKLCIRKRATQDPNDMFDNPLASNIGYADLVEDMYYLSSEAEYLQPYSNHYDLKTIYVGKDEGNKMMFSKSSNLFHIENMSVQNYAPEKGTLSLVYSGHFNIVETFLFDNLQRYLKIGENYPDVVKRYTSYYHPSFIVIENRTLMQESINKEGSVTKVTVFSPDMEENFVNEMIIKTGEDNFFSKLFGGFK